MSDASRIVVRPRPAISLEDVRDARARALRYALDRYLEKQKAAKTGGIEKDSRERRASSRRDEDCEQ
jgi:hypothetical protein